jgi:hypothetical protein
VRFAAFVSIPDSSSLQISSAMAATIAAPIKKVAGLIGAFSKPVNNFG